jgi:hypothetical protein
MTKPDLQLIVDRVMTTLPAGISVPHPTVIDGARDIPPVQRRAGVQEFRYGAVICLPMLDLVYIYRERITRDFGDDLEATTEAIRRALIETVAAGFTS